MVKTTQIDHRLDLLAKSARSDAPRVEARTLDGTVCILAGLNRFDRDMTMAARFPVEDLLTGQEWIRLATEAEETSEKRWWRSLAFRPGTIIHSNGQVAVAGDTLGMYGDRVTVLQQSPVEQYTTVEVIDLDGVATPPTPPPELFR